MRKFVLLFSMILLVGTQLSAQNQRVSGTVTGPDGAPVIGATVLVEGTQTAAFTDPSGQYSISVPANANLVYSYFGMVPQTLAVGSRTEINVVMAADVQAIESVVVTALGILRKEETLTYSAQVVSGEELSRVKDASMLNSLAGKTSGVSITRSAAGVGGSTKVVIRGSRSFNGVGGPLYVIDGIPIGGTGNGGTNTGSTFGAWQGGHDTGDAMSQLNPDDIASMSILKGPSAAALYGTSAGNGVILITTKKGQAGKTDITFSSNTTFDIAAYGIPEFQNSYGGGSTSWGKATSKSADYVGDFFQPGLTTINSLSGTVGNDRIQAYFSYANTFANGVVPGNELNKHNFNFRETGKFLNDQLTIDANVNLMYSRTENMMSPGGLYMNPLTGLYRFPRGGGVEGGKTWADYRDNYQIFDPGRNMYTQNWYDLNDLTQQNPFWLINKTPNDNRNYRALTNLSLSYKINDLFTVQARGKVDYSGDTFEKKLYAGTHAGLVAESNGGNGFYGTNQGFSLSMYGDVMLSYAQTWDNWTASATLGASVSDAHGRSQTIDSSVTGLDYPNIFHVNNIVPAARPGVNKYRGAQDQAVFFAGQVGWKDQVFLDVTARNDWTSRLAYTKSMKGGFFYPSVGMSWLLSETLTMPEWISLGKVRASWAQVGNGLPSEANTNPLYSMGFGPQLNTPNTAPFGDLKPEMTGSIEFGTEWKFFGSRIELDATYYKTDSRDQAFQVNALEGSKYTYRWVNAGHIRNEGFELTVGGTPVVNNILRWHSAINFSTNKNTAVKLVEGMEFFQVGESNSGSGYNMRVYEGGSFGDIYGYAWERGTQNAEGEYSHEGAIVFDENGIPLVAPKGYMRHLGNTSAKFNIGWQNTITYKGINLYFLIDGRVGGQVVSATEADMDLWGTSKRSGDARDRGYVEFAGRKIEGAENIQKFYQLAGGRGGVTEQYVYSATNFRLRELSLGYSLPARWLQKSGWVKGVDLSLIGRNLLFFYRPAPYDPDALMSTGMGLQGYDVYGTPSMRSFGFNVKINF